MIQNSFGFAMASLCVGPTNKIKKHEQISRLRHTRYSRFASFTFWGFYDTKLIEKRQLYSLAMQ